jgi:hypothetical protein
MYPPTEYRTHLHVGVFFQRFLLCFTLHTFFVCIICLSGTWCVFPSLRSDHNPEKRQPDKHQDQGRVTCWSWSLVSQDQLYKHPGLGCREVQVNIRNHKTKSPESYCKLKSANMIEMYHVQKNLKGDTTEKLWKQVPARRFQTLPILSNQNTLWVQPLGDQETHSQEVQFFWGTLDRCYVSDHNVRVSLGEYMDQGVYEFISPSTTPKASEQSRLCHSPVRKHVLLKKTWFYRAHWLEQCSLQCVIFEKWRNYSF